jgi:septum formation protein
MSILVEKKLILASSSPRRQELIRMLQLPCEIRVSDVNEDTDPGMEPQKIVEELSIRKAAAVCDMYKSELPLSAVVIGSDTIVVQDGQVLGKPRDSADAFRMLTLLQGRTHQVLSGIACIDFKAEQQPGEHIRFAVGEPKDKAGGYDTTMYLGDTGQYRIVSESPSGQPEVIVGHTVSKVTFRPMSDEEIEAYVKTGEPLDKAGAYGVQGLGSVFVERIEGDFYSIMGLPLNLLYQMLLKLGISPF